MTPTDATPDERLVASQLHTLADIPVTEQDVEHAHNELRSRLRDTPSGGATAAAPHTRTLLLAAAAAAVALIAAALWASNQQAPGPAGKVIAQNPFLSNHSGLYDWGMVRTPGVPPHRLSRCVDPGAWNARSSRAATYQEPARPGEYVNEYLLDYATPAAAHRALMDAWHQINQCPKPAHDRERGQFIRPGPVAVGRGYDEGFGHLESRYDTSYYPWYALRVARVGNVLVVLESTSLPIRAANPSLLTQALVKALPQSAQAP